MVDLIKRVPLADQVQAVLETVPNTTVYVGEVATKPPTLSATDLRVKPYLLLFPGAGLPTEELDQGDTVVDLDWNWQVQCVAGRAADVLPLVDHVTGLFDRWRFTVDPDEMNTGRARLLNSFGTPVTDKGVVPPRFYIPLIYSCLVGR